VVTGYACSKGIFAVVESRHYTLDCDAGTYGFICEHNASYRTHGMDILLYVSVTTAAATELITAIAVAVYIYSVRKTGLGYKETPDSDNTWFSPSTVEFMSLVLDVVFAFAVLGVITWAAAFEMRELDPSTSRGTENPTMRAFTRWAQDEKREAFATVYVVAFLIAIGIFAWVRSRKSIKRTDIVTAQGYIRISVSEFVRCVGYAVLAVILLPLLNSSQIHLGWLLILMPFASFIAASIVAVLGDRFQAKFGVRLWSWSQLYMVSIRLFAAAFFIGIGAVLAYYGGKSFKWADADLHGAW
jgi:hypothetical protein